MTRPTDQHVNPEQVPRQLTCERRFVGWKRQLVSGRSTKVPYVATDPKHKASSTNPSTWRTFDQALAGVERGDFDGLGICLGRGVEPSACDRLGGIDFDHCIDVDGNIDPRVAALIARADSYTEVSPSRTGIRIFAFVDHLPPTGRKRGNIEMYNSGRYLTVTGHRLPDSPHDVCERTAEFAAIHADVFQSKQSTPQHAPRSATGVWPITDDSLIALASKGAKFQALWSGNTAGYPSHSEADAALCAILAFYTKDAAQIDRLFRRSQLMREKWDARRGSATYGQQAVANALRLTAASHYTPAVRGLYRPSGIRQFYRPSGLTRLWR